jgi:hypothetical protein
VPVKSTSRSLYRSADLVIIVKELVVFLSPIFLSRRIGYFA